MQFIKDLHQKIREHIDTHGQHLMQVLPGEDDPSDVQPYVYTIGNHERGLPELLLFGPVDAPFLNIMNRLGEIQRQRGQGFRHNELVSIGGKFPVRIVDAGRIGREEYALLVGKFYGTDDYELRQVLICDTKGRFPDDPRCDAPYRMQPVLSARVH